jgi:transcription elongation GreA/GreB family factor
MSTQYFLRDELQAIKDKIVRIQMEIDEAGKRIAEACEQGAETYHDNAPYDEAMRHKEILSLQLLNLAKSIRFAFPIDPPKSPVCVEIGTKVTVVFYGDAEPSELTIGSFINVMGFEDVISYTSPLGQAILGALPGAHLSFKVQNRQIKLQIIDVKPLERKEKAG